MSESSADAFERGHNAGVTAAELIEHGRRLDRVNGSIERHAVALETMALAVEKLSAQTQADNRAILAQMMASAEAVRTTADALAKAEDARIAADRVQRDHNDRRWSPLTRAGVVVSVLVGLATLVALVARTWL